MDKRATRHWSERPELTARGWAALGLQVTARELAQDLLRDIGFNPTQLLGLRVSGYGVQLRKRI